jgi:phosphomannomutase
VNIYGPCDICGRVGSELTPELYRRWGCGLGMQLPEHAKFVVGGDFRPSTPAYQAALMEGLCRAGLDVVNLGILPTPMVCHAKHRLQADGCAIVTASHQPVSFNGLKWMLGDRPPTPDDVEVLRRAAERSLPETDRPETAPRGLDISFDYVANLQETWLEAMGAHLHVVLDPMFGGWSGRVRRYLHAVFPQCLFTAIRDQGDGDFAGQVPDCSRPPLLHELTEAVYRERADLGIAFDGDGDRTALVDDQGVVLTPEEAACVLLETFPAAQRQGRPVVYDQKFSDRLPERIGELGAEPLVERSGHAFLRARMIESGALFGAEISGHYFYQVLEGGDDGLYTACRLIAFLAQSGRRLSKLRRQCPPVYMTPELRLAVTPEAQPAIFEHLRTAWASFPQRILDGVRIDTPAGWMIVCPLASEAALTFRFESLDWPALDDLVDRFCQTLPDLGNVLRQKYAAAMGTAELQNGEG